MASHVEQLGQSSQPGSRRAQELGSATSSHVPCISASQRSGAITDYLGNASRVNGRVLYIEAPAIVLGRLAPVLRVLMANGPCVPATLRATAASPNGEINSGAAGIPGWVRGRACAADNEADDYHFLANGFRFSEPVEFRGVCTDAPGALIPPATAP
eukprot:1892047-Amphidinium_carterae.1